ncbi:MAG: hydantoinase B/oxoprolinase family protein, partial [Gammaproteobacteria bacterium]|nr:hydantoinase B/oxoprolinase family protein [Gammaproteobacteria bacterium]
MNPIELGLFVNRLQAVCDEMGATLRRAAFSPNIKDRLDFSCAVFDAAGGLCAQAAHIPVHLGSMAYAMQDIVQAVDWAPGDMVVVNDPYLGGTHLPDVTLVAPLFVGQRLAGFCANRAHHADIGCATPGSMPLSRRLDEEGLVLSPRHYLRSGILDADTAACLEHGLRNPRATLGDFAAQCSANRVGLSRLAALVEGLGAASYGDALAALNDYAETLAVAALRALPDGEYRHEDCMDDDGYASRDVPIRLALTIANGRVTADFGGTAAQVDGNINCPLAVTAAAVYYALYALMPRTTPPCAGSLRVLDLRVPPGCLLNARPPAAVAAGNVETSQRIVDVVLGALARAAPERVPAASQGTMNNVAMGGAGWDYYETIGGGCGAHARAAGCSAMHSHMTNTLNTPVEVLEAHYPVRVTRYALRRASGGAGRHRGGDGILRAYEFLAPATVTVLSERRRHAPPGLAGGGAGRRGENRLNGTERPAKATLDVTTGDRLELAT